MFGIEDKRYADFIRDKSVIFVGPSPCITGEGKGDFIDSHDVVIRTNGAFPLSEDMHKDYGKKCDVLYTNCLYARVTNLPVEEYIKQGMKFLIMKEDKKNITARHKELPIEIRTVTRLWSTARTEVGASPLMGAYIVWEILKFHPKSLYLTGMDNYSNPDIYQHYICDYLPNDDLIPKLNHTRVQLHNQDIQNNYIKSKIEEGLVDGDSHVKTSLNL